MSDVFWVKVDKDVAPTFIMSPAPVDIYPKLFDICKPELKLLIPDIAFDPTEEKFIPIEVFNNPAVFEATPEYNVLKSIFSG